MIDAELRSLKRLCSKDDLSDSNVATLTDLGLRAVAEIERLRAKVADMRSERVRAEAERSAEVEGLTAERDHYRAALANVRAEARDGFQSRLDAAEAAMIQVLDDALASPAHVEPPADMSAEFARVVRAVRVNVVMRERAKDKQDELRARCDVLEQECRERDRFGYDAIAQRERQLRHERDSARALARVLAHAYEHDSRPPAEVVRDALAFPVIPEDL